MSITKIEKISFTKHLSVMVRSGITLSESLLNLSDSAKSVETKKVLSGLATSIANGSSFAKALEKHPQVFDEFYRGIIRVGEATGRLDSSLAYLSDQLGQEYALEKKVKGALMYPSLVMTAALGLGAFISLYILPQLVDFFSAFESKLPFSTIILLRLATFMKSYGLIVFGLIFGFIILTFFLVRLPSVKPHWHSFILKLPLFGSLLRERELSRFSRNLGTLIKSGLPVFEALEITSRSQTNLSYRSSIIKLSQSLEKGRSLADTLKTSTSSFLFPRLVADMISVGEKTGTIDESLIYVSQFYQDDIEETARNLTTILEPAILIVIGLMVAFLAFAIIGPIYQLTGAIG